jgi:hypothetical protein
MAIQPSDPLIDGRQKVQVVDADGDPVVFGGASSGGDASAAKQDIGNASLASIDTKLSGPVPVSGPLTDSQLRATAVPVSGTVTATGPLTDAQLRASAVPVSGTFYQATQPVSASSLPLPSGAATSAKQDTGNTSLASIDAKITAVNTGAVVVSSSALPSGAATAAKQPAIGIAGVPSSDIITVQGHTSGTPIKVDGSNTVQPISGSVSVANWPATQPVSGTVTANAGTGTMAVSATSLPLPSGAATESTLGTLSGKITTCNTNSVTITAVPTLTKGTQGSTGFTVQEFKDAGRTHINLWATSAASGATGVETAISLTKSSGTSPTSAATSFVVTSGKTFRITSITVAARGHATATAQLTTFNLRINTGGAVTTSSTPIVFSATVATPATASAWDRFQIPIGDGFEIAGNGTLQFGLTAAATFVTNAPTWFVTITGYEY